MPGPGTPASASGAKLAVARRAPAATSQTLTVRSRAAVARRLPSGRKTAKVTAAPWLRVRRGVPATGSQRTAVPRDDVVTSVWPSAEKTAA